MGYPLPLRRPSAVAPNGMAVAHNMKKQVSIIQEKGSPQKTNQNKTLKRGVYFFFNKS